MRVGALFEGGGGLTMAVKTLWPNARTVWCSEVDTAASALLAARMPDVPNLGDITAIDWHDVEPVDVLVGGFPCQDISYSGKRAGIKEGTRSGLWFHFADAVRILRPSIVLAENVAGITTLPGALDAVLGELADCGFDAEWGVLRASDVGAPHARARWFLAAAHPDRSGGHQAVEHHGHGTPEGHRAGVPDQRDRGPVRARPDSRWREYAPAIDRWQQATGTAAPHPVDDRLFLDPAFVEWQMGWPVGWTDVDGLSRANRLKILGNGVVPQQAAAAFGQLLARATSQEVAA